MGAIELMNAEVVKPIPPMATFPATKLVAPAENVPPPVPVQNVPPPAAVQCVPPSTPVKAQTDVVQEKSVIPPSPGKVNDTKALVPFERTWLPILDVYRTQ